MGVFNATQNQVLARPVSAYYEGKAMRAGLETKRLQNELLQDEVDSAPARRKAAEEKASLDQQKAIIDVEKGIADLGYTRMKRRADALRPVVEEAEKIFKAGQQDKASQYLSSGVISALQDVDPEAAAQIVEMRGDDNLWQPEEMMALKHRVEAFGAIDQQSVSPSSRKKQALEAGLEPGTKEFNDYVLNRGGDAGRQRDDEIRDTTKILTKMGVPDAETEAVKQVDNKIIYTIDPNGGAIYRTDKITGKSEEVDIQGGERGAPPEIKYEDTLHGLADEATGIGPGAKAFVAAGLGPIGGYVAEATTTARAKFKAAENTLIRAFSLNPRYPVAEQKRVTDNIQIQPTFWDSAPQMRARMAGIRDFLEQERDTAKWEASRPGIGRTQKTIEENTVADIDRFLATLGKPPEEEAPSLDALPPAPDGIDPEDWRYFTPEARARALSGTE